jgi:hypothetical protein
VQASKSSQRRLFGPPPPRFAGSCRRVLTCGAPERQKRAAASE